MLSFLLYFLLFLLLFSVGVPLLAIGILMCTRVGREYGFKALLNIFIEKFRESMHFYQDSFQRGDFKSAFKGGFGGGGGGFTPPNSSEMGIDECFDVLGLQRGATKDDIIKAHRKLIQQCHPDKGGSEYLARKINQARDTLIK